MTCDIDIDIGADVVGELDYLTQLHRDHGAPQRMESTEMLVRYVLGAIAHGSMHPGSKERRVLELLGLVADCREHKQNRPKYNGKRGSRNPTRPIGIGAEPACKAI